MNYSIYYLTLIGFNIGLTAYLFTVIANLRLRICELEAREFNLKVHGTNPRIELNNAKVGSISRADDLIDVRRMSYGSIYIHHD